MAYTTIFIDESLITDKVAVPFKTKDAAIWEAALKRADDAVRSLARRLGVMSDDDIQVPLETTVQDYALAYFYFRLFKEVGGVNDIEENELDKYQVKSDEYKSEMLAMYRANTYETITGDVADRGSYVQYGSVSRM
jgi:hypothetical protein